MCVLYTMPDRSLLNPFFLDQALPGLEALAAPDWWVNRPALPVGDTQARMAAVQGPLADLVAEALAAGERPIVVAGDCCATIAVGAGLGRAGLEPVLVWLDATATSTPGRRRPAVSSAACRWRCWSAVASRR